MKENLAKLKDIFKSPALTAIARWSKCVHGQIAAICLLSAASSLLSLGVPLVTRGLIDGAEAGNGGELWKYGAALVVLIAASRGIGILGSSVRIRASARLQESMQRAVTVSILGKEYASVKPYHSGELVNRVFSDVSVVKSGVMSFLPSLIQIGVSFIGAAAILISMDWRFVPVLIGAGIAGSGVMALFRGPMKRRHKRMQEAEGALHAATQETLENLRVVKASGSEGRAAEQIDKSRGALLREQVRNGRLSMWMNQGMGGMFDISWLVCNLWGCVKIFHRTFTYGSLAALIQLVGRIQSPIASAVGLVSQAYGVVASAERLQEVVGLPDEEQGEEPDGFDEIVLRDVDFQYADGTDEVLLGVNASVRRGQFVALTGISGGGKTSLFQLLLGIYKPTRGSVFFRAGGREIPAGRGTRRLFAYVPQGNTLMSGTLRDNLTMFTDSASDEQIAAAVRAACLEDLVESAGYGAVLGERGIGLSEGQAQRVAIARALLSGAPILLLDEATSALDEQTEAKVLANISAMRDKTCIIVTHRPAALAICDSRLHIEGGRVTEV